MKSPWSWVFWLVAVLVWLSVTRNPLYLVIILSCIVFTSLSVRINAGNVTRSFSPMRLVAWIILFAALFNALTSHFGGTILFIIPGRLPLISGKVTLEAVIYGVINGLVLTGMLASFTVLNMALPVRDLVRLIPRTFYPVAVVTSIAVSYLPTTVRQFNQIREAQAIRGHQMRKLRDWLPLLMPLLVGGLEHAMQLSEAMTARGFASSTRMVRKQYDSMRLFMLLGIGLLAVGWITNLISSSMHGWIVIGIGALFILIGLRFISTASPRTSYHRSAWSLQDGIVISASIILALLLIIPKVRQMLYFDPYPVLHLPGFDPLIGIAGLGLLFPGLFILIHAHDT